MTEVKRINLWDNIKGILIVLVVLGHCLWEFSNISIVNDILRFIYLFHMPVFVFVSGYFGTKKSSPLGIARLIFAYFIFNSLTGILYGYSNVLIPLYSYWYILALILWRLTADKIDKIKHSVVVTLVIGLLIGFIPGIDNTLAFQRFIAFYPFYIAGYKSAICIQNDKANGKDSRIDRKCGLIALLSALILSYLLINKLPVKLDNLVMYSYVNQTELLIRLFVYVIGFLYVIAFIGTVSSKRIPLITDIGRNSMSVFLIHRVITLVFSKYATDKGIVYILAGAVLTTLVICVVFGNDFVGRKLNSYLKMGGEILLDWKEYSSKNRSYSLTSSSAVIVASALVLNAFLPNAIENMIVDKKAVQNEIPQLVVPRVLTSNQKECFDNAYRIVFAGDLLLLEDQVKRGLQEDGTYCFDDVFEYAKPYIESADFSIGVFEGPMAGADKIYSEGNYDDNKELYLNFPREFGEAVLNAGFDLVTTAGNHLLDRDFDGMITTLCTLDDIGIDYIGSYSSSEDKDSNNIYYFEQDGISFAVLAYTYGINYHDSEELYYGDKSFCTSFIYGTEGELFEEMKRDVEFDFAKAREMNSDFIIVLPHYGTQFSNTPDEMQLVWNDIFKENGADIILGDHAHSVQPINIELNDDGSKTFEAFCPGNFANIYRDNQGDTSALIEVYIDRDSKEIIGGGVIPLYTQSPIDGNYRAIPIYEIMNNSELRKSLTDDDYKRAETANSIVSYTIFGEVINVHDIQPTYLFDESGYLRPVTTGLKLTEDMVNGELWPLLESSENICFLGDSITEGTANCGCPWYEPILEYIPDKTITNFSKGGCTVKYLIDNKDIIPTSDLYVIAIGTNDVRHFDREDSSVTPEEYINRIKELTDILLQRNPSAELVFIAPWYSTDGDTATVLSYSKKLELNKAFSDALYDYCHKYGYGYININEELKHILDTELRSNYMVDHIHPNSTSGVILYSELVLKYNDK